MAVDALPRRTRIAMLEGIRANEIIAGGYTQKGAGGICPMLAAHRNGGRTNLASFARAWDRFTGARRPRLATRRELRTLASSIELSLLRDEHDERSVAALAAELRAQARGARASAEAARGAQATEHTRPAERTQARKKGRAESSRPTGERHRARELRRRSRWAWLLPARRYDVYAERLAAAEQQLSEQRAEELLRGEQPARPS
jgi:hypothetical protein